MSRLIVLISALLVLLLGVEVIYAQHEAVNLPDADGRAYAAAVTYLRRGEFLEARNVAEKALRDKPSDSGLYELVGYACVGLKEFDRAIHAYTKAVQLDSHRFSLYCSRGGLYALQSDWEHAIKDYNQAIVIDPDRPEGYYGRASAFLSQYRYSKALEDFEASYKRGCGTLAAYSLARLLAACPDPSNRDAKRSLEYACMICQPSDFKEPLYLDVLAMAHAESGHWEEAVRRAEETLRLAEKRNDADGGYCAGVRMRLELYRLHEPYRQMPSIHPDNWSPASATEALLYGVTKIDCMDYKGAIEDLRKAIELNPRLSCAYYALGCAMNKLGNADDAITYFTRCLELDPKHSEAFYDRAVANSVSHKFHEALADSNKALAINSNNFLARLTHAWALGGTGETDRAIKELDQLNREYPDHDQIHFVRGFCFLQLGRFNEAVVEFTCAIRQNNRNPLTYAERAIALTALGRNKDATSDLKKCICLAPPLGSKTEERIKEIKKRSSLASEDDSK